MIANRDKLKKDDRVLVLKIIDGKLPLAKLGQIDRRCFSGDNKLHARFEPQTGYWHCAYEFGVIPGALTGKWMSFDKLLYDVQRYLKTRNIEVEKVLD